MAEANTKGLQGGIGEGHLLQIDEENQMTEFGKKKTQP